MVTINFPLAKKFLTSKIDKNKKPNISERNAQEDSNYAHLVKKAKDTQMMDDLVKKSNRCIISLSTVFPWTFFPTTIYVEESRITFVFKQFLSSQSHSLDIKDISNIFIESSYLFASIQIVSRTYIQNDIKIAYLNLKQAYRARRIIEGLRTFAEHHINTSNFSIGELISKIEELHEGRPIEQT